MLAGSPAPALLIGFILQPHVRSRPRSAYGAVGGGRLSRWYFLG